LRGSFIIAVLLLHACSQASKPADFRVGVLSPAILELARRTGCDGGPLLTKPDRLKPRELILPWVEKRLANRPLAMFRCESGLIHIVYTFDDMSIYLASAGSLTKEQVEEWLRVLQQSGLDASLIARARERLSAPFGEKAPGEERWGLDPLETPDHAIQIDLTRLSPFHTKWDLAAIVFK